MLWDRYGGVVKSSTYRSAITKCTGKVIRQTIWNYLQYYRLLNLTVQWRWQFWGNNVILSVQVLVKAVDVKLLKVMSEITVFSETPCSSADTALRSQKTVTWRGQGRELWQFVLTPRLGSEVYNSTKYWRCLQNSTVQCQQEQFCRRSGGQPLTSWCTHFGIIKYTPDGADCPPDTSHLFSVLPFPPLPILWNVAFLTCITAEFHCIPQWYVLSFTCIFSRCCLQYASVLQAGITFQAINWRLFFYIPEQKGSLLVVSVVQHTFTTTQNTKLLQTVCTTDNY